MRPFDAPDNTSAQPGFHEFVAVLVRRIRLVLAVAFLVPAAALVINLTAHKQYKATAELLFRDPQFDQKLFGSSILAPSTSPVREAATNVKLVSLDVISARAAEVLKDNGLTAPAIRKKVAVLPEGQADLVAVEATDASPALAAIIANTIAEQYIAFRRDADRAKIMQAIGLVQEQYRQLGARERTTAEGRSIRDRVAQLRIMASLQTGNAELVQRAQKPVTSSSPRPARNTFLALIGGLLLAAGVAVLRDRLDQRLRHARDAEAILNRPVLGAIPSSKALKAGSVAVDLDGQERDAFRALRTNLRYFAIDRVVHSLLITSSAPGDGKSTVARCLAATAAASDVKVVLLEADLRRPSLLSVFRELESRGVTDVLLGQISLDDVIQQVTLPVPAASAHAASLDVVCAGPVPPNPTDLLESDRMQSMILELESRYELVIIDTSPVSTVPDAIPLMHYVSGVAIVMRVGKSTRAASQRLREQLRHLRVEPLGIILNGVPPAGDNLYYRLSTDGQHNDLQGRSGATSPPAGPSRIARDIDARQPEHGDSGADSDRLAPDAS